MELFLLLLEQLSKAAPGLGLSIVIVFLMPMMIYMLKKFASYEKHVDKRFDEVIGQQKEMEKEYREGFKQIENALEEHRLSTARAMGEFTKQLAENRLMTLKTLITNESLPLNYRFKNYDEYIKLNGNSWIREYYDSELKPRFKEQD